MDNKIQLRTSSNGLPSLNTTEAIVEVRLDERYPRYGNIPQSERLRWMSEQTKNLATIARIKDYDGRDAIVTAASLDEMVMRNEAICGLKLPEIAEAFKSGLFGLYGEFYGLTAPNLYGFLLSYIDSDRKKEATAIIRKGYEQRKREEQEENQRKIRAEIEEAKRNGTFVPTGRVWFKPQMVDEVLNDEHRKKVRQQAREILRHDTHAKGDGAAPLHPAELTQRD